MAGKDCKNFLITLHFSRENNFLCGLHEFWFRQLQADIYDIYKDKNQQHIGKYLNSSKIFKLVYWHVQKRVFPHRLIYLQ